MLPLPTVMIKPIMTLEINRSDEPLQISCPCDTNSLQLLVILIIPEWFCCCFETRHADFHDSWLLRLPNRTAMYSPTIVSWWHYLRQEWVWQSPMTFSQESGHSRLISTAVIMHLDKSILGEKEFCSMSWPYETPVKRRQKCMHSHFLFFWTSLISYSPGFETQKWHCPLSFWVSPQQLRESGHALTDTPTGCYLEHTSLGLIIGKCKLW